MSQTHICPQCGATLPADAPDELCPKCLLQMGFESHSGPRTDPAHRPTQYQPRSLPPHIEELVVKFPQLEILERIGQGGMGVVYKARQKDLDRVVALKILRPDIEKDPAFSERFVREARALAKLSHPAIVTVHDFGSIDGFYYFIMEFIDGANLRELEQAGKLEPRQALAIVPQICEALQYAHDQGLVHRDIKPENILIDRQGRVKIADFGLAKMVGIVPDAATLTGAWQALGTPHYMAPEQMQGLRSVDHRADIYSLGVVIYEMLTGELPLGRFPLPSQKVQVDVRLDEVVLRALEHEPGRRYQQVNQIKTDVETISRHPGPDKKVSTFGYRSRSADESTDSMRNPPATPRKPLIVTLLGLACLPIGLLNLFLASLTLALPGTLENELDELIRERPGLRNWHAVHLAAESWLEFPLAYVLLGAGVGLLLLRPWGRWLALGWGAVTLVLGLALLPVMFAGIAATLMQSPAVASEAEREPMMLIGAFLGTVIVVALDVVFPSIVLLVLNRPRVKQAFATRIGNGEIAMGEVAESRKVLVACWNYCVQQQPGPTRIVLLLVYLGAFILFFSMEGKSFRPDDGPPTHRVETTIGVPFPWFEHWSQKDVGAQTRINLFTSTWLIAIAAFVALRLALDVRPKHISISLWELPETHMIIWFLIGLAGVLRVFVEAALTAEPKPHYVFAFTVIGIWLALALCGIWSAKRINRLLRSQGTSGN